MPRASAAAPERGDGIVEEHGEVDRSRAERQRPGLDQRERPQILDQPVEGVGLLEDGPHVFGVGRIDAIQDRLELALDDRERRPQLVGDVGEVRAPLPLGLPRVARSSSLKASGELAHVAGSAHGTRAE